MNTQHISYKKNILRIKKIFLENIVQNFSILWWYSIESLFSHVFKTTRKILHLRLQLSSNCLQFSNRFGFRDASQIANFYKKSQILFRLYFPGRDYRYDYECNSRPRTSSVLGAATMAIASAASSPPAIPSRKAFRGLVKAHDTGEVGRFNFLNIHDTLRPSGRRNHTARSNAL